MASLESYGKSRFNRKFLIFSGLFLLIWRFGAAQEPLSPAQMRADVDLLWKTLVEVHPKVDYACPMSDLEKEIGSIREKTKAPMTVPAFFLCLNRLVSRIHDSHTLLSYPAFPDAHPFPPFDLLLSGDRCYLRHAYVPAWQSYLGQEIYAINGRKWPELYALMLQSLAGETEEVKRDGLQSDTFKILWACLFPLEAEFYLAVSAGNTPAARGMSRSLIRKARGSGRKQDPPSVSWGKKGDTGIIAIRTFQDRSLKAKWPDIMKKARTEPIRSLLLDLRGNTGGDSDLAEGVAATFLYKGVRFFPSVTVKVSQPFLDHIKQRVPGILRFLPLYKLSYDYRDLSSKPLGALHVVRDTDPVTSAMATPCPLPLWVLIDGNTVSSAAILARCLQMEKRAVLVGRPGGSAQDGLFGQPLVITLPNSKLTLMVSSMLLRFDNRIPESACQPLTPDYPIDYQLGAVLKGEDSLLDQAIKLIKGMGKSVY